MYGNYNNNNMRQSYLYTPSSVSSDGSDTLYPGTPVAKDPLPTPVTPAGGYEQTMTEQQRDYTSQDNYFSWGPVPSQEPLFEQVSQEPNYTNNVISISTSFPPDTDPPPDTIFASSDNVFFYTIHTTLLAAAPNAFLPALGAPLSSAHYRTHIITLDLPSTELNILLHALHRTSPAGNAPPFAALVRAIDRMPAYALPAPQLLAPHTPLYALLLAHAPLFPLDTYALAAHHGLAPLAATVSAHLLSHNMATVSDEMAERIGPVYLKRLLLLHAERFVALKDILLRAPMPHEETETCSFEEQRKVTRAWALVSAYLVWDATPDISTHTIGNALNPLLKHLTCKRCEILLEDKIKDVMVRWTAVKRTI